MEADSSTIKRRYDITMSKRTRKQPDSVQNNEKPVSVGDTATKDVPLEDLLEVEDGENQHKNLKQLINGDEKDVMKLDGGIVKLDEAGKGRNSLGQHFTEEEKNLQLVRRQQQHESVQGLKFKKLVRRYAKVLSQLMKAKRDPHLAESKKKPVFKLSI